MTDKCSYICNNKTSYGYCKTTVCINQKYNGSGTYLLIGVEDGWIKVNKKAWDEYLETKKMIDDPDYGCGIYS